MCRCAGHVLHNSRGHTLHKPPGSTVPWSCALQLPSAHFQNNNKARKGAAVATSTFCQQKLCKNILVLNFSLSRLQRANVSLSKGLQDSCSRHRLQFTCVLTFSQEGFTITGKWPNDQYQFSL